MKDMMDIERWTVAQLFRVLRYRRDRTCLSKRSADAVDALKFAVREAVSLPATTVVD